LVAVTVSVEAFPATMEAGLALMLTVGMDGEGGAAVTVTFAVADALPPVPVAVAV
jgi:hypothetical protein